MIETIKGFFQPTTTDSIIKPLLTKIRKLETHIGNQRAAATKCEEEIVSMRAKASEYSADARYAMTVSQNLKTAIGK